MTRCAKGAALLLALAAAMLPVASAAEPAGAAPRMMALSGDHVLGRRGPGLEHRVDWIYRRDGLPVRVTAASGPWRRVEDPGGAQVWVHQTSLTERRTVFVLGGRLGSAAMRRAPRSDSRTEAYLERGVVAALEDCRGGWRRVKVDNHSGWVQRDALWGAEACPAAETGRQ